MHRSGTLLILFLLIPLVTLSQHYNFRQYSLEQGLPQSEVIDIIQDSRGNLWVGTNGGGISRFNGKTFQTLNRKDGLADNNVRCLYQDSQENIWVGTRGGISRYNGTNFHNYTEQDGLPSLIYFKVVEDNRHHIWALGADQETSQLFYLEKGKFHNFQNHNPTLNKDNRILNIFQNNNSTLYLTCQDGLYTIENNQIRRSPLNYIKQFQNTTITPLFQDSKENLWIRTFNTQKGTRLFKMEGTHPVETKIPSQISPFHIGNIRLDSQDRLWIAIMGSGIALLEDGKLEIMNMERGLLSSFVNVILEDKEGNIWLATSGDGLIKYGANKFLSLNFASQIGGNIVRNIFQDTQNNYWFALAGKGVVKYKDNKMESFTTKNHPGLINIRDFHQLPNGHILMTGFNGILEFDGHSFVDVSTKYSLPKGTPISDICSSPKGLWIAAFTKGVVHIQGNKRELITKEKNGLYSNNISNIYYDNKGNVWLCHYRGVSCLRGDSIINYDQNNGLNDNWVLQTTQDHLGRQWFATYSGGINIWDPPTNKWTYITSEEGLTSDNVYSILCDEEGDIWAGTQNGVDKITYNKTGSITSIKNYNKYDGFIGIENNGASNLIDKSGNLWFGTINGAMMFNPSADNINPIQPTVQLTEIKLFSRKVDWSNPIYNNFHKGLHPWFPLPQNLRLPHNKRHLTFEFEALSYMAPEKVKYQWILEGLDKQWSPVSHKNEATYTNIPSGEYTFKLNASNSDGIWSSSPLQYSFEVLTPWWNSWWARIISVLLLGSTIYLFIRYRLHTIQVKKKELEMMVLEKASKILTQKNEIEKKNIVLERQKNEILKQAQNLQKSYEDLKNLSDIGKIITANLSLESIIDTVYETVNSLMDASIFGIGIHHPKLNSLLFPRIKEDGKNLNEVQFSLEDNSRLAVICFLQQKEVFIKNLQKEYGEYVTKIVPVEKTATPKSVIYLPLHNQQRIMGVITVQSFNENAFKEYHLNLLRNIAVYASIALENASTYRKIHEQTRHLKQANYDINKQKQEILSKNNELLELNTEKNHLIGIIAHDLKNPLTSTLSIAEYLKEQLENNQQYEQLENVEYMLNALRRMNNMVSKILDIRVIENQSINLKMERTNLAKLMKAVNHEFQTPLQKKNLQLKIDCGDVYAKVDPNYMTQIYENLISNAIKFSPLDRQILVKIWTDGEVVRTLIKDQGPGLTDDDKKRLFGKYQVLSAKPTAGEKSTGLGLSIVKKYVEAMNGKVWCESEPGEGANFFIELQKA